MRGPLHNRARWARAPADCSCRTAMHARWGVTLADACNAGVRAGRLCMGKGGERRERRYGRGGV